MHLHENKQKITFFSYREAAPDRKFKYKHEYKTKNPVFNFFSSKNI